MARHTKNRLVSSPPEVTYFRPEGVPSRCADEVSISLEEMEAVRLRDLEGMEQDAGAVQMGISRPTFYRVLASARKKIAEALLNGKAVRINGGHFEFTNAISISGCPNEGRSDCCLRCPKASFSKANPVLALFKEQVAPG